MTWIDMHCDTISELMRGNAGETLKENHRSVNLNELKLAGTKAQFFACFIYAGDFKAKLIHKIKWDKAYEYALQMLQRAHNEIALHSEEIAFAGNTEDLRCNADLGKISAFLTIEEGGILNGKIERLEELYREGVRLITLTWNYENCIGYPNNRDDKVMMKGLKPFGFDVIAEMNRKGMLIDVSHLSDGGFWDVMKYSKAPVVASHSNARALCPHRRNLSDEMIRGLAEKGGVAGVNFYPYFLNGTAQAGAEDLLRHIEHMYQAGGEDFIALGTDFDGFDGATNEIQTAGQLPLLYEVMKRRRFSERQMEKFCHENVERVIQEVL